MHFINTVCQLAEDTLFMFIQLRKPFKEAAANIFSLFLLILADVSSETMNLGPFKFLKNISLTLVLYKSNGSNLSNGKKQYSTL